MPKETGASKDEESPEAEGDAKSQQTQSHQESAKSNTAAPQTMLSTGSLRSHDAHEEANYRMADDEVRRQGPDAGEAKMECCTIS